MVDKHDLDRCGTCPFHLNEVYRTTQLEEKHKTLKEEQEDLDKRLNQQDVKFAVLCTQFKNIRYPIWFIFATAIVEIGRIIYSMAPSAVPIAQAVAGGTP